MNLTVNAVKGNFFDRQAVINAVGKAERRVLSKAGANVRKKAMRSIRYGDRPSRPGRPPAGHRTVLKTLRFKGKASSKGPQAVSPLREFLFFSYDRATRTVVVGPALLSGKAGGQALHALEHGGPSAVVDARGRRHPITVRARPFMAPALAAEARNFPELFRNSVR